MTKEQNEAIRLWEYHTGATTLRSRPDIISIESTNHCNLKCVMCPRGEPDIMRRHLGSMSTEVFRKIVQGWEYWGDPMWFHMFGEPLMHPELFEQIAIAKEAGVPNLAISTNATLLTARNASKILSSGLDKIILCIDGNNKETYEAIRKSTEFSYEEVCANVGRFLEMRPTWVEHGHEIHATVQIVVMEETKDQLDAFREKWEALGADEVVFKEYCSWGGQDGQFAPLAPLKRQAELKTLRPHPCMYLWQGVTVMWDGRVVPCCYDYDAKMVMGDLRHETLDEIWNGAQYVELRANERAGKNDSALCGNCSEAPYQVIDPHYPKPEEVL